MDAFIDLPTFATVSAGTGDIAAGMFTVMSPLIFWGWVIGMAVAIVIIFIAIAGHAVDYANEHWNDLTKKKTEFLEATQLQDKAESFWGFDKDQKEWWDSAISSKNKDLVRAGMYSGQIPLKYRKHMRQKLGQITGVWQTPVTGNSGATGKVNIKHSYADLMGTMHDTIEDRDYNNYIIKNKGW